MEGLKQVVVISVVLGLVVQVVEPVVLEEQGVERVVLAVVQVVRVVETVVLVVVPVVLAESEVVQGEELEVRDEVLELVLVLRPGT